jgi:hypothetical protein
MITRDTPTPIPSVLAGLLTEFSRTDSGEGECVSHSMRFAMLLADHGLRAQVDFLQPGPTADPMQGWHAITRVRIDGEYFGVDWTAAQFSDLTDDELPRPLVWSDSYPYADVGLDWT